MQKNTQFFLFAGGIFTCYFYFALMQEKITRGKYGEGEGERFTCTLSLVLVQCIFNYLFVKFMLVLQPAKEKDNTKLVYYFSSALTYLLGMVCSNMALQWVNYPTQVIGKSAKPIPVMILGVLIGHKSYPLKRYIFVFLIVIGVATFMFKEQTKQTVQADSFGIGELLLILSLIMDGLTGAVQDRMRVESAPSAKHMMLNTNYWSSLILIVSVILSGEIFTFKNFLIQHPIILWHLLSLAVAGGLGQLCIFLTISHFGPLVCSVVTTTRKFFTVLASVLIFGNVLLPRQWLGAVMVFAGLFLDIFYGKDKPPQKS